MSTAWVTKLPLAEHAGAVVLVHITPKAGDILDLDLLATDGDSAFKGKGVRGRKISSLRHKNYDGSEEEWSAVLKHVFRSKQGSGVTDAIKSNLNVSCSISGKDPKAVLTISFRTRIENITQRLGSVELLQDPNTDDVDLFGWATQVIDQRDGFEDQVVTHEEEATKYTETIVSLRSQLEELVKAKEQHEFDLLAKFAALLNEKKLHLRNLKRQMSTAKVDKRALDRLEENLSAEDQTTTRGKKRSARETKQASESEESDGFEAMDVDKPAGADHPDEDRRTTDGESETESDDGPDQAVTSQTESGSAGPSKLPAQKQHNQSLPPPRELPFTRQAEKKQAAPKDDEETESEDDEL